MSFSTFKSPKTLFSLLKPYLEHFWDLADFKTDFFLYISFVTKQFQILQKSVKFLGRDVKLVIWRVFSI